jgi:hypothetical protein
VFHFALRLNKEEEAGASVAEIIVLQIAEVE